MCQNILYISKCVAQSNRITWPYVHQSGGETSVVGFVIRVMGCCCALQYFDIVVQHKVGIDVLAIVVIDLKRGNVYVRVIINFDG